MYINNRFTIIVTPTRTITDKGIVTIIKTNYIPFLLYRAYNKLILILIINSYIY